MPYLKILFCSLLVIMLDQATKLLSLTKPELLKTGGFFELYLTYNTGVAFGMPIPQNVIFILILLILVIGGFFVVRKFDLQKMIARVPVALILGGAIGNLIDRIRLGQVVDFIKVGPWPMFNLADSAICIGAVMIVIWGGKMVRSE
ncbi:MAG: signal peptidase II [Candidatus Gracilibacteria bacterium]|nr:signal peptidase II [Candidatus Gracilibacteria bacterium]